MHAFWCIIIIIIRGCKNLNCIFPNGMKICTHVSTLSLTYTVLQSDIFYIVYIFYSFKNIAAPGQYIFHIWILKCNWELKSMSTTSDWKCNISRDIWMKNNTWKWSSHEWCEGQIHMKLGMEAFIRHNIQMAINPTVTKKTTWIFTVAVI